MLNKYKYTVSTQITGCINYLPVRRRGALQVVTILYIFGIFIFLKFLALGELSGLSLLLFWLL